MEEKTQIKKHLDQELKDLHFTKHVDVLNKIKQPTKKEKLSQLWNKEVTIPILPVSSVLVILLFSYGIFVIQDINVEYEQNELINIGGNRYWQEDIEGRMKNEEQR